MKIYYVLSVFTLLFWPCRIVSMLDENGILKVANVGDCGLRVIRKGKTNKKL